MSAPSRKNAAAILAAASAWSCQAFVDDYDTQPRPMAAPDAGSQFTPVDVATLCEVERERFVFEIDFESDSALSSLEQYYERANPELVTHLANLRDVLGRGDDHAGVTYLVGGAGVGKSFLTRNAFGAFAPEQLCEVVLGDWFGDDKAALDFEITLQPDLMTLDGSLVFNELPALATPGAFELEALFRAAGCYDDSGALEPLIVIDGIDEVTDSTSVRILERVDAMVLAAAESSGFLHVLIAGRPGGFAGWFSDPRRNERNNQILQRFDLEPPRYQTRGDLRFRALGYLDFTQQLEPLEQDDASEDYLDAFYAAVEANTYLPYSLGNLSLGNAVIENTGSTWDDTPNSRAASLAQRALKQRLTDDILFRNAGTHGRPGDGGRLDETYQRMLEDIAVANVEVSGTGEFRVQTRDSVDVRGRDDELLGVVRVSDVLNRGGVAFSTSPGTTSARFRFEPFWLHAHLVELYNLRHAENYEYRGCD